MIKRGVNLNADGRPIMRLSCHDLLELILTIDDRCLLIPCHIWTPHFGVYGSASGFDSLREAFGDLESYVYGIETGISSDPEMNWLVPELETRSILSFSDAHSAPKMGREATIFDLENLSYGEILQAIKLPRQKEAETIATKLDKEVGYSRLEKPEAYPPIHKKDFRFLHPTSRIIYTVEFYPEEGKYHYSGHRSCKVSFGPDEIANNGNICPVCHHRLTEGVLCRVQQITGRKDMSVGEKRTSKGLMWLTDPRRKHPPFVKLVPLLEIVAESLHSTLNSQKSLNLYNNLCLELQSELNVLLHASIGDICKVAGEEVAKAIEKVRIGKIAIKPGFDGVYGKVNVWEEEENNRSNSGQLEMGF